MNNTTNNTNLAFSMNNVLTKRADVYDKRMLYALSIFTLSKTAQKEFSQIEGEWVRVEWIHKNKTRTAIGEFSFKPIRSLSDAMEYLNPPSISIINHYTHTLDEIDVTEVVSIELINRA